MNAVRYPPAADNAVVTAESESSWTLTGDCSLAGLDNHRTIDFNGYSIMLLFSLLSALVSRFPYFR